MSDFLFINEEDGDNQFQTEDSSTESCTGSPIAEECENSDDLKSQPPTHTEESSVMINIDADNIKGNNEDDLLKVLNSFNGLKCDPSLPKVTDESESEENVFEIERSPSSILRRSSCYTENREYFERDDSQKIRQVSFPDDESVLATFKEPECSDPWRITKQLSANEILEEYKNSCKAHRAVEIDTIKKQIHDIKNNMNRTSVLNISLVQITSEVNETLEDLFRIANFHTIQISECKFTQETVQEFLNMLEYYEPTSELTISDSFNDLEAWRRLCDYILKSTYLQSLKVKDMTINEQYMRFFLSAINLNTNITSLTFDKCNLDKTPSYLIESIMTNRSIQELYLIQVGLYTKEAECLGRYLSNNSFLQLLDLSNNFIGDRGLEVLANGLAHQQNNVIGLLVLILVNNQLTEKCGPIINSIISTCGTLRTLNIGFNNLTDKVIECIQEGLSITTTLEGLGLQSTLLTCTGANFLADAIENNKSLEKINLKGNKAIQSGGLESLCKALTNSKIIKVELDEHNRSCSDPQGYNEIVKKINGICTINKSLQDQKIDDDPSTLRAFPCRKISLSCEPRYTLPPFYSDSSSSSSTSGTTKNRFHVLKVSETSANGSPSTSTSRFKVFSVATPTIDLSETNDEDEDED